MIRKKYGARFKLPSLVSPKFLVWLVAPLLGLSRDFVSDNVNYPIEFDNNWAMKSLAMEFRSQEEMVTDHAEQIVTDGLV